MKQVKNLIVQVKVYKGQVNFDEKGRVTSTNQLMKIRYGIREWDLFLKSINQMGWTRVDVIKCLDGNNKIEKDGIFNHPVIDTPDNIAVEIKKAMVGEEKQLTPEQKEIKQLKAQMAKLDVNEVPEMLRHRLLSVRAYNSGKLMIGAEVVQGKELESAIDRQFQNRDVEYIHIHNANPGCFNCSVYRA